jgi:hypothetical protein
LQFYVYVYQDPRVDEAALARSLKGKYTNKGYRIIEKELLPENWQYNPTYLEEFYNSYK